MNLEKHLINHVSFVIDSSGSMSGLTTKVRQTFNDRIKYLRESSLRWNQETRVSVYIFDSKVECTVFDMDVTRVTDALYRQLGGMTSLNDATNLAFQDSKLLPQKYGDHAFLNCVITDGQENNSKLKNVFPIMEESSRLGNYTWSILVPDASARNSCLSIGYSSSTIEVWDVSEKGLELTESAFKSGMENYYTLRSSGVRSVGNFLQTDMSNVKQAVVANSLNTLPNNKFRMLINTSNKAVFSKDLVEQNGLFYKNGNLFYELVKTETVQPQKDIAIQCHKTDKVYVGSNARQLLGLPNHEVKLKVGDHGDWNIFIQSTAPNRNIIPKQRTIVLL